MVKIRYIISKYFYGIISFMNIEKTHLSDTEVCLTIALDQNALTEAEAQALKQLAPTVTAKGFRKGKVPTNVAKKQLDPSVLANHTIEIAVNKALFEAFNQEDLNPLDQPKVDITKFVPEQQLEFKAIVPIVPEIKLPDYKKLKTKKTVAKVTDQDVEDILTRVQKGFATDEPVDRPAKLGDKVVIDFKGYLGDKPFEGGEAKDYTLELGSGQFIPGFEEGIVGKKAEDRFDLKLKFPKDYHAKNLAGKAVVFTTSLKKVLAVKLPELNDDLAKQAGDFKTLADFKADIRKNLIVQKEEEAEAKYRDQLVDELGKKTKVAIPEVLKTDQINALKRDMTQNLMYRGMTLEQYLASLELSEADWTEKELAPLAEARVKSGLAIAEVSKLEKIEVSEAEVDIKLAELKTQYAGSPDAIKQLDNPTVWRDLRNNLLTEKTINKLVEVNA